MNNKRFSASLRWLLASSALLCAISTALTQTGFAEVPDWLRTAARETLPAYPPDTRAVVLLEEQQTTVSNDGQVRTVTRRAIKILRPERREPSGEFAVSFDPDTRISYLKAWSLPTDGREYEVKEKDWSETSLSEETLYQDTRHKFVHLPFQEPGTIIAYECQQNRRPSILQDIWYPQDSIPVHRARYTLQLPSGWQYRQVWMNTGPHDPVAGQNRFVWELLEVAPIEHEPSGPPLRAVALRLGLSFLPPFPGTGSVFTSWTDVAEWHSHLWEPAVRDSPEIQERVKQLTASASTTDDRLRTLAGFVQKEIRYVAIEIGLGAFQPHPAASTLTNKYGDCKDKATLLAVLLRNAGIQAYPVLVYNSRGVVRPEFPSPYQFNHMILAVRVPVDSEFAAADAALDAGQLGRLLLFDPTAEMWPLGTLPDYLQNGDGLLLAGKQSLLLRLPLAPPESNRMKRLGEFELAPDGTVNGSITEIYTGAYAAYLREILVEMNRKKKGIAIETWLSAMQGYPSITHSEIVDQVEIAKPLVLRYEFRARDCAKLVRDLMLMRLPILGAMTDGTLEWKGKDGESRMQPLEYQHTGVFTESGTILLPSGFAVDELPGSLNISSPALSYSSRAETDAKELKYKIEYRVSILSVPITDLEKLRAVYRDIHADEQRTVVLKREP